MVYSLVAPQTEGKKANIRALLCSLHTVVWEDCRWTRCDMSQLVTPADVKRNYRKACLAVHPDKVSFVRLLRAACRENHSNEIPRHGHAARCVPPAPQRAVSTMEGARYLAKKSDTAFLSTQSGRRFLMIFPVPQNKKASTDSQFCFLLAIGHSYPSTSINPELVMLVCQCFTFNWLLVDC